MNDEHTILNHYNLTTPSPTTWPAEKDESDGSENEKPRNGPSKTGIRRSKSRYSALERSCSDRRSLVSGSEKLRGGQENLVQKDEPDPLGVTDSVVRVLRQKGLPVEEDQRLSAKCLMSQAQPVADSVQGTDFFFPLPHSHQIYIYHKYIRVHPRRACYKALTSSPAPSTRSRHL